MSNQNQSFENYWIAENIRQRETILKRLTAKNPFKVVPLWFSITTLILAGLTAAGMAAALALAPQYLILLPAFAIIPGIVLLGCKIADRYEPERMAVYAWMLAWGLASATGIAIVINTIVSIVAGDVVGAVVGAPVIEEGAKLAAVAAAAYLVRAVDGALDGAILGAIVGAGFTVTEDIVYVLSAPEGDGFYVGISRLFIGGFLHVLTTALAGAFLGAAAHKKKGGLALIAWGMVAAMAIHGTWNLLAVALPGTGANIVAGIAANLGLLALGITLAIRQGGLVRRGAVELVNVGYLHAEEGHFAGNLKERKRLIRENPGQKLETQNWFAASARASARKGAGGSVSVYDDYQLELARENLKIPRPA